MNKERINLSPEELAKMVMVAVEHPQEKQSATVTSLRFISHHPMVTGGAMAACMALVMVGWLTFSGSNKTPVPLSAAEEAELDMVLDYMFLEDLES